MAVETNTTKQS